MKIQRLLLELNLLEPKKVDKYLKDILNRHASEYAAKDPNVVAWMNSVVRKHLINSEDDNSIVRARPGVKLPDWAKAAVEKGENVYKFDPITETTTNIEHILDWLNDVISDQKMTIDPSAANVQAQTQKKVEANKMMQNITNKTLSYVDAVKHADDWTKSLIKKAEKTATKDVVGQLEPGTELKMQFPDGYFWLKLKTGACLDREGRLMQHCVGSYARQVQDEKTEIYSLRDQENQPHVTVEVKANTVYQIKGKQNQIPAPKYVPYVGQFIDKMKWQVKGDYQGLGWINFKNKVYKNTDVNNFIDSMKIDELKKNIVKDGMSEFERYVIANANLLDKDKAKAIFDLYMGTTTPLFNFNFMSEFELQRPEDNKKIKYRMYHLNLADGYVKLMNLYRQKVFKTPEYTKIIKDMSQKLLTGLNALFEQEHSKYKHVGFMWPSNVDVGIPEVEKVAGMKLNIDSV